MDMPTQIKPRLNIFSGLKLLAVIGIISCHFGGFAGWDLCARMVEVLFLISGFCMAYNHYSLVQQDLTPFVSGWKIIRRKLPKIYPVHLVTFLLQLCFVTTWSSLPWNFILPFGLLNLTLQHAWFQKTQFMFNNVSWFLSALMFCYFITPALTAVAAKAEKMRRLWLMFLILVLVRLYLEYMCNTYPDIIYLDLHVNPLIQGLNYSLGFIAGIWFVFPSSLNKTLKKNLSANWISLLEIMTTSVYLTCCWALADKMYRLFFILLALPVIYILAYERGIIAKLLSLKVLVRLSALNLEIFMFHSFILYHFPAQLGNIVYYAEFAILTLLTAVFFKKLIMTGEKYAQILFSKKIKNL